MKIAFTYTNNEISNHFGQTKKFLIVTIFDNVIKKEYLDPNGKSHHELAKLLIDENIDALICGTCGDGIIVLLHEHNIKVYNDNAGKDVDTLINDYLNNKLVEHEGHSCECHH
jgi:predicted Fe-Mo cluster-binding NifX family protein